MTHRKILAALALALGAAGSPPALAETALTLKEAELRKEPLNDAALLGTLPAQTTVEVVERKGGWTRIRPQGTEAGWTRMFNLRFGDGAAKADGGGSGGGLASMLNVARTGSSGTTVTTGVKGLDITGDTLQNASPNPEALRRMHGFAVSRQEALAFAGKGGLKSQKVDYPGDKR